MQSALVITHMLQHARGFIHRRGRKARRESLFHISLRPQRALR